MFVDGDFSPVQVTHNHAYHRGIQICQRFESHGRVRGMYQRRWDEYTTNAAVAAQAKPQSHPSRGDARQAASPVLSATAGQGGRVAVYAGSPASAAGGGWFALDGRG
jgi:hypothetical protein